MSPFPLSALPRCVALRSKHDNSYLHSVHDESHGGSLMELRSGDGGLMNPRARFYLEPSKEHEGHMHIRCYNNKYWVPQQRVLFGLGGSDRSRWVIGTADEPEEDLSKPSCTLHKLIPIDGEQPEEDGSATCRFLHSKLGKYACTVSSTSSIRSYMHISAHEDEAADRQDGGGGLVTLSDGLAALVHALTVIDVSDHKQLPTYVAFKGDNGCFLGAYYDGKHWLKFCKSDVADETVWNTTFTNDDGVVRIKSNHFGQFWRRSPNWIWADSDDTTYDNPDTLFRVTTGPDFVALKNLGNNSFCKRLTDYWESCLNAGVGTITLEAKLQCYEPVVSRKIYDVDFRLGEAKTSTKGIDGLHSQTVKNGTSVPNRTKLSFKWTKSVETTWSSTVSLKITIETSIETGVPFFVDGEVKISTEFSASYTWGKNITETEEVTREIEIDVPPMKKVTVKAIGSNGVCDIPFSYKQKDVLLNGEVVIKEFTDGMYYGVKTSDVTFETIEEDL